jgi:hypothetical protein
VLHGIGISRGQHPGVSILVEERESLVRFTANDMARAQPVLAENHMIFEETEVAVLRLAHRPGPVGRTAARLSKTDQHRPKLLRSRARVAPWPFCYSDSIISPGRLRCWSR